MTFTAIHNLRRRFLDCESVEVGLRKPNVQQFRGERSQSSSPAKPSRSRGDAAGVHGQRRSPSKAKASALGQRSHLRDDGPQAVQRVRIGASSHFKGTPLVCCRIVETSVRSNPNVACDGTDTIGCQQIGWVSEPRPARHAGGLFFFQYKKGSISIQDIIIYHYMESAFHRLDSVFLSPMCMSKRCIKLGQQITQLFRVS